MLAVKTGVLSRSPKAREWDDEQSVGLPEAGGFGPISGLRTTAALCLQLLFPFPFPFLPPPPPFRLSAPPRGRGWGEKERGRWGGGRWFLSNRPPSQSRLLWWVLCQGDCLTHIRGREAGAAWEDGLRNPRHPAPGECWAPLLPAGGGAWAASKQGFACRVGQQPLTSLGLRSWRRGSLKVRKN